MILGCYHYLNLQNSILYEALGPASERIISTLSKWVCKRFDLRKRTLGGRNADEEDMRKEQYNIHAELAKNCEKPRVNSASFDCESSVVYASLGILLWPKSLTSNLHNSKLKGGVDKTLRNYCNNNGFFSLGTFEWGHNVFLNHVRQFLRSPKWTWQHQSPECSPVQWPIVFHVRFSMISWSDACKVVTVLGHWSEQAQVIFCIVSGLGASSPTPEMKLCRALLYHIRDVVHMISRPVPLV